MGQSVPTCCCYNRHALQAADISGFTPRVIPSVSGVAARGGTPRGTRLSPAANDCSGTHLLPVSEIPGEEAAHSVYENSRQDQDCADVSLIAPLEQPSVGSRTHWEGTCKRCCFFAKDRCTNGADCEFCHYEHEKRRRIKRKRKNKSSANNADAGDAAANADADDALSMSEDDDDDDRVAAHMGDIFQFPVPVTPDSDAGIGQRSFAQARSAEDKKQGWEIAAAKNRVGSRLRPDAGEFAPAAVVQGTVTKQAQQRDSTAATSNVALWWTDQTLAFTDQQPQVVMPAAIEEPCESGAWRYVGTASQFHPVPEFHSSPLSTGMSCFHGPDVCQQGWNTQEQFGNSFYDNGGWPLSQPPLVDTSLQQSTWYYSGNANAMPCDSSSLTYDASMRHFGGPPQDTAKLPPGVEVAVDMAPVTMVPWVHHATDDQFGQKLTHPQQRFVGCRVGGA